MIHDINEQNFQKLVRDNHSNVLVFVRTDWCSNCKAMESYLELAAIDIGEENIFRINADDNPDFLKRYKVLGVPTTLLFSHGVLIERKTGILNNKQLVRLFKISESYTADEAAANELKGFFRWPF